MAPPRGVEADAADAPGAGSWLVGANAAGRWLAGGAAGLVVLVLVGSALAGRPDDPDGVTLPSRPRAITLDAPSDAASDAAPGAGRVALAEPPPRGPLPRGWRLHEGQRLSLYLPPAWSLTARSFVAEAAAPRDLLSVATFDLDVVADLGTGERTCPSAFPEAAIRAVGFEDVLVVIQAPSYVAALASPPPLLGTVELPVAEVTDARAMPGLARGLCSSDVTFHTVAGRSGERWAYQAWVVVGRGAPLDRVEAAVAVFNSFRPGAPRAASGSDAGSDAAGDSG